MDKWRLLKIDFTSYMDFRNSLNLGILRARKENLVPDTVVILRTLESSICASYYPDIDKDADLEFLRKRGVQVKRFHGGAGQTVRLPRDSGDAQPELPRGPKVPGRPERRGGSVSRL